VIAMFRSTVSDARPLATPLARDAPSGHANRSGRRRGDNRETSPPRLCNRAESAARRSRTSRTSRLTAARTARHPASCSAAARR
jgi:hypothetical protein